MTLAEELGAFFAEARPEELPAVAREHGAMVVASTLASAACGIAIDSTRVLRSLAEQRGGKAESSLWFTGGRLPAAAAAQVNAVASDAAASDDSDLRNIVHAGTPATAVALALGEARHAGGAALVAAVVLGYEAAGRIASAITPGFRRRGFHGSIGAVFAAAVAAGRLLGLDRRQMAEALGLAATSIGGLTMAADTSTAREYHAGAATWQGVQAALAAEGGFHGELSVFEGRGGFFSSFGGDDGERAAAAAREGLGGAYDIVTDMAIKLGPGAHSFHAIAEAAALAAAKGGIAPEEVSVIAVARPDMAVLSGPLHLTDLISMAHSPAYFAAAGVADGGLSWAHATPEKITDERIHRLIDRVAFLPDPSVEAEADRYRQGATVTVSGAARREGRATVYLPNGAGARGIRWADVDEKCRALLPEGGLTGAAVEACLEDLHGLESLADVAVLSALVTPRAG
ncbi:MAG TPA: MmgE/PrpD family protein [Acidimicrobiales bacterium]|nr:MmgE/PrpD family protein [Acidimicrobiales bacterium]